MIFRRKTNWIRRALILGGLCLTGVGFGCSSVMYQPSRFLYYDPAKMGLKFDEVRISSFDGTSLYGWRFHQSLLKKPKGLILFAHGNAENMSSHFTVMAWVLEHGYDLYIFDYRGYGASGGDRPQPEEGVRDTIAALKWADAQAKREGLSLIAFGQSMGTAMLTRALIEVKDSIRPKILVLESPFLSFQWAGASVLSQHWITTPFQPLAFLLLSDEWAPKEKIRELSPMPLLIFHGDQDRVVDVRLGERVYEAALPPKEFVRVPRGGHIQAFWGEDAQKYRKILISRLDAAVESE